MKIWIKYLIAILIGVAAGLVVPLGDGAVLETVAGIVMNLSRYALLPLVFFSAAVAVFELHEERTLHKVWLRTTIYSLALVVALAFVGLAGAFIFTLGRIPLSTESTAPVGALPDTFGILASIVSPDALSALRSPDFMLPAAVFGMVLGLAFAFDKAATKPAVSLFDSLSRIFWQINSFFVEILPLPLIVMATARTVSLSRTPRIGVFGPLFLAIGIEAAFVVLILAPLLLWLLDRSKNPYRTIYAITATALAALASGHTYVAAGVCVKHLKESLGVRRRSSAVTMPLVLALGRAGTAMVTATSFVAILNSYSNLGLGSSAIFWMIATVPMVAIFLGAAPGSGPIVGLAALCASYGRGFESGYILLVPALLPLAMLAAFLDCFCMACVMAAVASNEGHAHAKDLRHFI